MAFCDMRALVHEALRNKGEAYSVELWEAWKLCGGERDKRRGVPKIQRELKNMEMLGLIKGRDVAQAEHRGRSLMLRRYYRAA